MQRTVFEARVISIFNEWKFVFYSELQHGGKIQPMPISHKAGILAAGALAGFGVFMIDFSNFTDAEVKPELEKIAISCDIVGIRMSSIVQLVLFVHADDLTDEALVGKSQLIREKLNLLKKFSMRVGWTKLPVFANIFFVFSSSEKAFHFRQNIQSACKHHFFLGKTYTLPWGIDLSAKSVWAYKGFPANQFRPSEIEAKLFS